MVKIFSYSDEIKELSMLMGNGWKEVSYEDFNDEVKAAIATILQYANDMRPIEQRKIESLENINANLATENTTVKQENASVKAENQHLTETNQALKMAVSHIFTADESKAYINTYQEYQPNHLYGQGEIFRYEGKLYITTQSHTSQADWKPDATPALYIPFEVVGKSEGGDAHKPITDFKQPTGAHDAYKIGDKVRYQGKVYECLVDNCTYSPSGYPEGWKEIQ